MKSFLSGVACTLMLVAVVSAYGKPWVDYVPEKGFWQYTYVKVDPNYLDDYLTRLKTIWVPGREIDRKHGLIDDYRVMVNVNNADSTANVMFCVHYVSFAGLDPDKQRDTAIADENAAALPAPKAEAAFTDFSKYRSFVGAAIYVPVDFTR
ncbi:MAG: hypothetical protein ACM3ZT_05270 [Bacillota bacterium]